MFYKKLYIYILINQINAKNCCSKTCCCGKNKDIKKETEEKDKDKKDNKKQINDFGGVSGLIGALENNKVVFKVNTSSGLKKIAETVDNYNGEFNYENVKNLEIKLLGFDFKPKIIEENIKYFKRRQETLSDFPFLKDKIVIFLAEYNSYTLMYNFDDCKYYFYLFFENKHFILNADQQTKELLKYGICSTGLYVEIDEEGLVCWDLDKNEEYKKGFLEGK